MDRHQSSYNTVRILAPMPFYDHATVAAHHRHIAAGPGPGPGPGGGYAQPILVTAHHRHHPPPPTAAAYQLYHARTHFSTVNPAKMAAHSTVMYQQQQVGSDARSQQQSHTSTLNTWFTWKRKSKTSGTATTSQRVPSGTSTHQHHHHHLHASESADGQVPPSLARLFVQPSGHASVKANSNSNSSKKFCVCNGLTPSTFMAPTLFDDEKEYHEFCEQNRRKSLIGDENSQQCSNAKCSTKAKSKTLRTIKASKANKLVESNGGGTLRAVSTGSLLMAESAAIICRPFNTLKSSRLNQAKSCDHLQQASHHRKSILECDVNPYELLESPATKDKKCLSKEKVKCATVSVKSSRSRSQSHCKSACSGPHHSPQIEYDSIDCIERPSAVSTLQRNGHGRTALHKGIFNPANSIRIAGQSVYSSIKFGTNYDDELMIEEKRSIITTTTTTIESKFKSTIDVNQHDKSATSQSPSSTLHRSKSNTSLSEWSFDETPSKNSAENGVTATPKVSNFHSVLIEPEPDYDMDMDEDEDEQAHHAIGKVADVDDCKLLDTKSCTNSESVIRDGKKPSSNDKACRRVRSTSVTRPRVNPPPPPEPHSLPPPNIPPPPPPPPPNYFNTSPSESLSVSTASLTASLSSLKPSVKSNSPTSRAAIASESLSFQNELKEKLNQGVKSILKKTKQSGDSDSSSTSDTSDSLEPNDTGVGSVENRIQAFESTIETNTDSTVFKPKKHVHFRVKNRSTVGMSRSRSTSHIITETIHEEDDEHGIYDDVALPLNPLTGTRSFDDVSIVSISSYSSFSAKESHSPLPPLDLGSEVNNNKSNRRTSSTTSDSTASPPTSPHQADLSAAVVDSLAHFDDRSHLGCLNETDTGDSNSSINRRTSLVHGATLTQPTAGLLQIYDDSSDQRSLPHPPDLSPQPSDARNGARRPGASKLSTNHRFDTSSSPTPPPIPARRISVVTSAAAASKHKSAVSNEQKDAADKKQNSFSKAVLRSYSSGSVRSLLARKLNRTVNGNSVRANQSTGSKLTLSTLFSAKTNIEDDKDIKVRSEHIEHQHLISRSQPEQAEEHIYEDLDSLYVDALNRASTNPTSASSLFGARVSRAEILDYLHDARGRLAQREKNGNCKENNGQESEEQEEMLGTDLCEMSTSATVANGGGAINSTDLTAELNIDSGNSSFVDAIDYTSESTFVTGISKSRLRKARARNASADQNTLSNGVDVSKTSTPNGSAGSGVNRRNRVSNVSNSSSDSSATSGVSGVSSNLSDDIEEDDMITNSSSSLGSMANDQVSAGSASCYYGTCGSLGSGGGEKGGSTTVLERNDSGVGADISLSTPKLSLLSKSKSMSTPEVAQTGVEYDSSRLICFDCDLESSSHENLLSDNGSGAVAGNPANPKASSFYHSLYSFHTSHHLCQRCEKRRNERKEIISEIVDTELKYGRDLKIIQEEFARPISVAGLLTAQQVDEIFINLDELIEVNEHFASQLQDALDAAFDQDDEDLTTVSIGQIFHDCLLARIPVFEQYCIRQGSASLLLNQLEKEKELLRVFLKVSQMENTLLRRMNLRSFLVVPVQRVTKYPLLLNRLHKVTSHHHPDRESLREAQVKMEFHLESINQKTRGSIAATTSRIWRRISNLSSASIRSKVPPNEAHLDDFGYVRLKKTALDLLKWPKDETRIVQIGKLSYIVDKAGTSSEQINSSYTNQSSGSVFNLSSSSSALNNNNSTVTSSSSFWSRTLKFSTAHAILVTLLSPESSGDNPNSEPNSLTLFEQLNYAEGEQDSGRFNSASRRSNSKSPSRANLAATLSQRTNTTAPGAIREAALLLFKEKSGRYVLCRDTLNLSMCVIANATEVDSDDFFEIHELESRESLLLKAETHSEMKEWREQLRQHASGLGNWRRRRNALPNIMVLRSAMDEQTF